jgi:hypothetical protein
MCLSPDSFEETCVYLQKATNLRIKGYSNIQAACQDWEGYFQTDDDVQMSLGRVSQISPTTLLVQWNVTWIPPTALWLEFLAKSQKWTPIYCSYVHQAGQVSTFSYKAVAKLFWDAVTTQQLRIPLACIQGTTTYEFASSGQNNIMVHSITEDLSYAQDLQRGALQNRKCAQDLRLFLESGRRMQSSQATNDWDAIVARALPWTSVPGMNPLDIDPTSSDESMVPAIFLGFSALTLIGFAAIVAPELIGQSLFAPPTYIVPPQELNSIY